MFITLFYFLIYIAKPFLVGLFEIFEVLEKESKIHFNQSLIILFKSKHRIIVLAGIMNKQKFESLVEVFF